MLRKVFLPLCQTFTLRSSRRPSFFSPPSSSHISEFGVASPFPPPLSPSQPSPTSFTAPFPPSFPLYLSFCSSASPYASRNCESQVKKTKEGGGKRPRSRADVPSTSSFLFQIYIARHGFRINWVTENWSTPTKMARDPPLAGYGIVSLGTLISAKQKRDGTEAFRGSGEDGEGPEVVR